MNLSIEGWKNSYNNKLHDKTPDLRDGNTNNLFSTSLVTTEMLKHLNTEKSLMTSSLRFSIFFFLFFICLAVKTYDIARH